MPISNRGDVSNTGSGSVALTLPGGIAPGDVVWAWGACQQTSDSSWSEGSGTWSLLADLYANDTLDVNAVLYRKVQGPTPDSSVTMDGSTGSSRHVGVAKTLIGVDTSNPEDATPTTATGIDGGTPDAPAITTVTAAARVIAFGASSETDTVTNPPSGYGNLVWLNNSADIAAMAADIDVASPGVENPGTFADIVGQTSDSWCAAVAARPASGGSTISVGLASETNTAQALGRGKAAAIARASSTETAQAIGRAKVRLIGLASEIDTAQAMTRAKRRALGLASETDQALAVSVAAGGAMGHAVETDAALLVTRAKRRTLGLAAEADLGLPIGRAKARALGLALEADSGRPIARAKARPISRAIEFDLALPVVVAGGGEPVSEPGMISRRAAPRGLAPQARAAGVAVSAERIGNIEVES